MSARDGWASSNNQVGSTSHRGNEESSHQQGQSNGMRAATPTRPHSQQGAPILPPPGSSYYPTSAPNGMNIPGLPVDQRSPQGLPPPRPAGAPSDQPTQSLQIQHQPYGHTMQPALGQPQHTQNGYDRDREAMEARDRDARDREMEQRNHEQRERNFREQEMREHQQREQRTPHQSHAEPPQLHQPVAVGPSRSAIHGPNGILNSNGLGGPAAAPPPTGLFGAQYERAGVSSINSGPVNAIQNVLPFSGGQAPVAPGQQPILNDALSYLDQVKVQFSGEPNVYNQFLDIMKDFKSQAIDTPGVIRRVSQLFQGNPSLIQGFNTFLPPGYRIECGTADDPNAIRVTTPMGTTVSPMGTAFPREGERRQDLEGGGARDYDQQEGNYIGLRSGQDSHESLLSPSNRAQALSGYGQATSRLSPFDSASRNQNDSVNAALLVHQQEQRGVSQLQNAVSAATGEPVGRQGMSPMPEAGTPVNGGLVGLQQGSAGMEKRGPVEFNHAISYVNKIKNRFSSQPEIYKQFLEILQTYQRESKPIQDVYAQVTQLFQGAQDLLEDFKQFLPESAALAKAQVLKQAAEDATMVSNMRGDYSQETPRTQLPPMATFAPTPSTGRDNKRKRDRHGNIGTGLDARAADYGSNAKNGFVSSKRSKQHQHQMPAQHQVTKTVQADAVQVEPSLRPPALPEPMPPSTGTAATSEELAFFDKVKKFIGPRSAMNEFLKLCNLYSQDLIDKNLLVKRAEDYIGSNADLFAWFRTFVGYDGQDTTIVNNARVAPVGRVNLNNCRSLGQSYRLMPKREREKSCSGRDELCKSVLNDDWVSHPTWASEDSGFIAHRKNVHEEGLHRIEEERHDYDLHIANIDRTIQILEPFAQQAQTMSDEDKKNWTLAEGWGLQSHAIHKKVIAKIYGRDKALDIMAELQNSPARVLPVLLTRLRIVAEQWKASQREWDKVWRDQTQRMFWRSLDHQGVNIKAMDKRQFQTKTLCSEILVKYEEQKHTRQSGFKDVAKSQLGSIVDDPNVLQDAAHLLLAYAEQQHATDFPRLIPFIKEFIPLFFGMPLEQFQARISADFDSSAAEDDDEEETAQSEDSSTTRGRRTNGKRSDLLRGVLDRKRSNKDDAMPDSRATTPDVSAAQADEEMRDADDLEATEDSAAPSRSWTKHVDSVNTSKERSVRPNEPYERTRFNMYANTSIYCFFRMFIILYDRLSKLKKNEAQVHEIVTRAKTPKPAIDLGLADKLPPMFFGNTEANANYYRQVLIMLEESVKGGLDMTYIEEVLRRFYLHSGWTLYTFDRLMSALVRFAIAILGNDGKDKSWDIVQLFQKDRKKALTTHQDELQYRKQVEKLSKEGDLYKIVWNQVTSLTTIRVLRRDDLSFDNDDEAMQTPEQRWRAYVSSYVGLEPTEGVPQERVQKVLLGRNLVKVRAHLENRGTAAGLVVDDNADIRAAELARFDHIRSYEGLALKIGVDDYRINWDDQADKCEWWVADPAPRPSTDNDEEDDVAKDTTEKPTQPTQEDESAPAPSDKEAEPANEVRPDEAPAEENTSAGSAAPPHSTTTTTAVTATGEDGEGAHQAADNGSEFDEKFVMNSVWMKGLTKDEVDQRNADFRAWKGGDGNDTAMDV